MAPQTLCGQVNCTEPATHKFYWPGKEEPTLSCYEHAKKARGIAGFMGFGLAVEELEPTVESRE